MIQRERYINKSILYFFLYIYSKQGWYIVYEKLVADCSRNILFITCLLCNNLMKSRGTGDIFGTMEIYSGSSHRASSGGR